MRNFRSPDHASHIEKTVRDAYQRFASYIYSHLLPILKNDADARFWMKIELAKFS